MCHFKGFLGGFIRNPWTDYMTSHRFICLAQCGISLASSNPCSPSLRDANVLLRYPSTWQIGFPGWLAELRAQCVGVGSAGHIIAHLFPCGVCVDLGEVGEAHCPLYLFVYPLSARAQILETDSCSGRGRISVSVWVGLAAQHSCIFVIVGKPREGLLVFSTPQGDNAGTGGPSPYAVLSSCRYETLLICLDPHNCPTPQQTGL